MDLIIDINLMYEDVPESNVKISYIVKEGNSIQPYHSVVDPTEAFCGDQLAKIVNEANKIYIYDSPRTIDYLLTSSLVDEKKLLKKIVDISKIYNIKPKKGKYIRMLALNTFIEKHACALLWMLHSAQEVFKDEFYSYDTRYTVVSILRIIDAIIPDRTIENKRQAK